MTRRSSGSERRPPPAAVADAALPFAPAGTPADALPAAPEPHYHGHRGRLRERFLQGGPEALLDYELLELILFAASPRGDVKPLAKAVLAHFKSLAAAASASADDLRKVDGMGDAGIAAIKASQALALRLVREETRQGPVFNSFRTVIDYCRAAMRFEKVEQFRVFFLNRKNEVIADELQQRGTVDQAAVYPREVVKRALELGAAALILAHNHPSGDPTPSQQDIEMTRTIRQALAAVGIALHDHVIVGRNGHSTFKGLGLI
jgi:DNA repair protein RadC